MTKVKKFGEVVDFGNLEERQEFIDSRKAITELEEMFTSHIESMPKEVRGNIKSTSIYIKLLETLLENKEFCKSGVWVQYIKNQIDVATIVLDKTRYNPVEADKLIREDETERLRRPERKKEVIRQMQYIVKLKKILLKLQKN